MDALRADAATGVWAVLVLVLAMKLFGRAPLEVRTRLRALRRADRNRDSSSDKIHPASEHIDSSRVEAIIAKCPSLHRYRAPLWYLFDIAGTLATVIPHTLRQWYCRKHWHPLTRDLLRLDDGGVIAVDWARPQHLQTAGIPLMDGKASGGAGTTHANGAGSQGDHHPNHHHHLQHASSEATPVIMVMHGLCGSSESTYVRVLLEKATEEGYEVAVMNARGCGRVPIINRVGMHAARTSDFRRSLLHVRNCRPGSPVFAVGFSLGAGVLAKYMGEYGDDARLDGAVAVSPAWNFHTKHWAFPLWTRTVLLNTLREYAQTNHRILKEMGLYHRAMNVKTVREFDSIAVVGPGGFRDADDYYTQASSIHHSHRITVPMLAVSAADDPVCCAGGAPSKAEELGPGLAVAVTRTGGHLGFSQGLLGLSHAGWMEEAILDWFRACRYTP